MLLVQLRQLTISAKLPYLVFRPGGGALKLKVSLFSGCRVASRRVVQSSAATGSVEAPEQKVADWNSPGTPHSPLTKLKKNIVFACIAAADAEGGGGARNAASHIVSFGRSCRAACQLYNGGTETLIIQIGCG